MCTGRVTHPTTAINTANTIQNTNTNATETLSTITRKIDVACVLVSFAQPQQLADAMRAHTLRPSLSIPSTRPRATERCHTKQVNDLCTNFDVSLFHLNCSVNCFFFLNAAGVVYFLSFTLSAVRYASLGVWLSVCVHVCVYV